MTNFSSAKVVSIVPVGPKKVFDLEVKDNHNYVANNIVVHNCSYHDVLDHYGKKYNEEFYKIKDTFITYKHRRILCLTGDALVSTDRGLIRLDSINVGDKVKALSGEYHPVAAVMFSGTKQTFEVETQDGYKICGTSNHPILVLDPNLELVWKTISDLTWDDNVCLNINESEYEHTTTDSYQVTLATQEIPLSILSAPKEQKRLFLSDIFSGAGSSANTVKFIAYTCTYPKFLEQLQVMLLEFGILSSRLVDLILIMDHPAQMFRERIDANSCASVDHASKKAYEIPHTRNLQFANSTNLHLEYLQSLGLVFQKVKSVTKAKKAKVYDISVDNEAHLFTANGIVVHNCYPAGPNKKTLRGRCLVGQTLINTEYGFIRLNELIFDEGQVPVEPFLVDTHLGQKQVTHTYRETVSHTIKITTQNGFVIRGTPEHPIYVLGKNGEYEWCRLDEILVGQTIKSVSPDQQPTWSTISSVEDVTLKLIVENIDKIGDYPIEIRTADKQTNEKFIDLLLVEYATFYESSLDLAINLNVQKEVQIMLLHGFGLVTRLENNKLTINYFALNACGLLPNLVGTKRIVGRRNPNNGHTTKSGYHTETIKNVETIDEDCDVFDISVPVGHAFLANGMVSHNTRILCLTGDTLISTNKGLLPVSTEMTGLMTHTHGVPTNIVGWCESGTKEVFQLNLESGHRICGSKDHKIRVLESDFVDGKMQDYEVWKPIKDLGTDDYVMLSLGGLFPDTLDLNFEDSYEEKTAEQQVLERIASLDTFDKTRLLNPKIENFSDTSVWAITSSLCKAGYLQKHYRKGSMYAGFDRCYYTKTKTFDLEAITAKNKTRLRAKKDAVTIPKKMTPALATLLGYYNSDGSYNHDAPEFSYATACPIKSKEFAACFFATFGIKARFSTYKALMYGTKMYQHTVALAKIREFLRYVGLAPALAPQKKVPWSIERAPKDCVRAYLKSLMESDGNATDKFGIKVRYYSTSIKLALGAQKLLATLGIFSRRQRIRRQKFSSTKFLYCLVVSRLDAVKFIKTVGFYDTWYSDYKTIRSGYKSKIYGDQIAVRVRSIKSKGLKPTFDISVDNETHSLTANGVVVSNSSVDELGWFDNQNDGKVKMDATQVYVALDRSLLTVRAAARRLLTQGFDDIPNGYALNVSSPSSARDKIIELVAQSKNSKKIFGFRRATWDMNPNITKDDLSEEFAKNPIDAERDYGCNPPLSDNAFISNFESIEGCFIGKPNKLRYKHSQKTMRDGTVTRYAVVDEISKSTKANVLAIDAGYCVTGDTLIPTNCGLLAIKDFPNRFGFSWTENLPSVNLNQSVLVAGAHDANRIATWHYKGVKPVATVETASGHSITATLNHLQLVLRDFQYQWVKIEELRVGDKVCFNPRQAASEEFDIKREELWYETGLGVGKMLANNRLSPPFYTDLYAASQKAQLSFVAGLLDSNLFEAKFSPSMSGFISLHHPRMTYDFVKGVQTLLDSWGVFCTFTDGSCLLIESGAKFYQLLHSKSKFLTERREEFSRLVSCAGFGTAKLVDFVRARITKENLDLSLLVLRQLPEILIYEEYKLGSYDSHFKLIRQLLGQDLAARLQDILSREYSYSAITSITRHKEPQQVYDLSIADAKDHAYTANGMVIHNTGNSFGAVCAHIHEGMPIISCAMEVVPNPGMPLNHALIFREALHTIIKERNVKLLLADRWQSIKLLQDAELEFDDLIAHQYSLKYDDFWIIKQTMFDSEVVFPKLKRPIEEILKFDQSKYPYCLPDPIEHFAVQCVTVRDMGNSIDKGDGLTDDVFRAACLALYGLQSEKYAELFDHDLGEEEKISFAAIGHVAGRSSNSGQKSNDVHMSKSGQAIGVMFSKR